MQKQIKINPLDKVSLKNPWHLLAFGFGSGLSPIIPGTMGTLASIPFYLCLMHLSLPLYCLVILVGILFGIKICQITSDDMQVHDHGGIVWDEFIGFWITMLPVLYLGLPLYNFKLIAAGFVLFRFFDMLKPWPINWLDKNTHGGFGIMIDDIAAGLVSALALWLVSPYLI